MKKWISKPCRDDILFMAASVGYFLGCHIPRRAGLLLFSLLGRLLFLVPNREKKRTIGHLNLIYGDSWDRTKVQCTAARVFSELGKNLFDALRLSSSSDELFFKAFTHDCLDEYRTAFGRGRGVIAITAHVGCFELLLHFFARKGFRPFAIGRKLDDPRIDTLVRKMRSGPDIEYMDRTESSRKVLRLLGQGRTFGVLVDQDTKVDGVFCQFMGKTAFTPDGPVRMAMKFDIPVFVVTTARQRKNKHHVFISKEVVMENTGDFRKDLVTNVQKTNDIICDTIRKFPEQWVWMHRRWHTRPQGEEKRI